MAWKTWRGEEAKRLVRQAQLAALRGTAEEIMSGARKEVPLQDGNLLASGKVLRSQAKQPAVRMRFGGPAAPYALKWHERPARFRRGRKRRYLADPFNRIAWRGYRTRLRAEMYARGFRAGGYLRRAA